MGKLPTFEQRSIVYNQGRGKFCPGFPITQPNPWLPSTFPQSFEPRHIAQGRGREGQNIPMETAAINSPGFAEYKFKLNISLRLNLTFQNVFFSISPSTNICWPGYIIVADDLTKTSEVFCGTHSRFVNFPVSHIITITMKSRPFISPKLDCFHQIIDSQLLSSKAFKNLQHLKYIIIFTQKTFNTSIMIYKITTSRYKKIFLTIAEPTQSCSEIFDGPGIKSPPLKLKTEISQEYVTSAFQALVNYHRNGSKRVEAEKLFHFHTATNQNWVTIRLTSHDTSYTLPNTKLCSTVSVCVIQFLTEHPKQINVTITSMRHTSHQFSKDCEYCGLAFYNKQNVLFQHTHTACIKHYVHWNYQKRCLADSMTGKLHIYNISKVPYTSPTVHDSRSYYSSNSTFLLVFYMYKEYCNLTLKLKAQDTICQVISKQMCQLQRLDLSVPLENKCTVFQLASDPGIHLKRKRSGQSCEITIYFEVENWKHQEISLQGRGFLKGSKTCHLVQTWGCALSLYSRKQTLMYVSQKQQLNLTNFFVGKRRWALWQPD